ncbi:helix-turn-helix domain-containing protein [Sphingobium chungbukense]|nr:hypothetical protein [Sphingobium chungbukense]
MAHKVRRDMLGDELSSEPCWYILLDLYRSAALGWRVQITSLSPAIGAPHSTVRRWLSLLIGEGLIIRSDDPGDRRRSYVGLTPKGFILLEEYFRELRAQAKWPPS